MDSGNLFDYISRGYERPLMAEDCLWWGICQRRLWRKQSLKLDESAAIVDPQRTLDEV